MPAETCANSSGPVSYTHLDVYKRQGGSNTNVVPGKVVLKLDRRMIPEEDATAVEAEVRGLIEQAVAQSPGVRLEIKRLLLAHALQPQSGNAPLVAAIQKHGQAVFGEAIPTSGTPLYTDVRLYGCLLYTSTFPSPHTPLLRLRLVPQPRRLAPHHSGLCGGHGSRLQQGRPRGDLAGPAA